VAISPELSFNAPLPFHSSEGKSGAAGQHRIENRTLTASPEKRLNAPRTAVAKQKPEGGSNRWRSRKP
jgi:hypothetical protein